MNEAYLFHRDGKNHSAGKKKSRKVTDKQNVKVIFKEMINRKVIPLSQQARPKLNIINSLKDCGFYVLLYS